MQNIINSNSEKRLMTDPEYENYEEHDAKADDIIDNDELSPEEEGFMKGYEDDEDHNPEEEESDDEKKTE